MNKFIKITVSLVLTIIFLLACIITLLLLFFGAWLHTYNALTKETVVAEVIMYPIKSDDAGDYIEIEFTAFSQESALTSMVNPNLQPADEVGRTQKLKLYGDSVGIGGPMVKFHNELILLNFDTVYRLARVRGTYELDIEKERNRTEFSVLDLNGGFDQTWWTLNDNEGNWPYNMFMDRVQFSVPAEPGFRSGEPKKYNIVVTKDGFSWQLVGRASSGS